MENKRKALGKGLEQLFDSEKIDFTSFEEDIVKATKETDIVAVPIRDIRSNPYQPRKYFDEETLKELSDSIKQHGILEPIIVKRSIKGYEIVAGERRTKAAALANLKTVPAIIKDFSDEEMMDIALLENIQRDDLTSVEIAKALEQYINRTNITQEELAKKFSKSRSYITNLLGLLSLPKNILDKVNKGEISPSHARVLSKLEDEDLIQELTDKIVKEKISVRELERLSSNKKIEKRKPVVRTESKTSKQRLIENVLRDTIGTKVVLTNNKITIPYDSEPDLIRILEILNIDLSDK